VYFIELCELYEVDPHWAKLIARTLKVRPGATTVPGPSSGNRGHESFRQWITMLRTFVPDADREVISTMGCGRRSSCRRYQPAPSIATPAPAFPCRGARRCHSRGCRLVLWGVR
jgi:hypothetical protein